LLARDKLFQFLTHLASEFIGMTAVDQCG
jgi:hypothetical protein